MSKRTKCVLSGAAAGAANGFFGAGGGMVLIPLLTLWAGVDERKAFANSVLIILPMCIISSIIYYFRNGLEISAAIPYLVGGAAGGLIAGFVFKKLSVTLLRKAMGIMIIYGGIRSLL